MSNRDSPSRQEDPDVGVPLEDLDRDTDRRGVSASPRRERSASPRRERSASPRRERSLSPKRDRSASPARKERSRDRRRSSSRDHRRRSSSRDRRRSRSRDRGRDRDRSRSPRRRSRSRSRGRGGATYGLPARREPPRVGFQMFVAGFNFLSTERDVESRFGKYGRVTEVRIVRDSTGKSRGFGFVAMDDERDVQDCIRAMNGRDWEGRRLQVELCRNPK